MIDQTRGTGAFFVSDPDEQEPVLAIEDDKDAFPGSDLDKQRDNNNSSNFFVTL